MIDRRGAVFALALVPWSALAIGDGGGIEVVFLWGYVDVPPIHVVSLWTYVSGFRGVLPARLAAWPAGALIYVGAAASALSGILSGREDPRLTAGLLVVAGLTSLTFTLGIARRNPATLLAIPVGTVVMPAVAWWCYWPAIVGER